MRPWLTILIAVILLSQAAAAPLQSPAGYENTTLAELLADPRANDGRLVRVHGFLVLEFEGNSLHPTEADFRAERYDRSVWIDVGFPDPATQAISGKLAFVSGVFDADHHGHLGLRPGALVDITEIAADPADKAFPRPWRDDPIFMILAPLGLLGLFFAMAALSARARGAIRHPRP